LGLDCAPYFFYCNGWKYPNVGKQKLHIEIKLIFEIRPARGLGSATLNGNCLGIRHSAFGYFATCTPVSASLVTRSCFASQAKCQAPWLGRAYLTAAQLAKAAHVAGEVIHLDLGLRPHQADDEQQRAAHVVGWCAEDLFDPLAQRSFPSVA
jgi:hypothetical protein